jgi:hypothetical protein
MVLMFLYNTTMGYIEGEFSEKVLKYYTDIDNFAPEKGRDNLIEVMSLFGPLCTYVRGLDIDRPHRLISNREELETFFRFERTLRGKHILNSVLESFSQVDVRGRFSGTQLDTRGVRTPIEENFRDVFLFGEDRLVCFRMSLFDPGVQI